MPDTSFSFDPDSIASTSDAASSALAAASDAGSKVAVASDAASSALALASDAGSKATAAMSKASDASSALVARQRVVILKVYNEASAISTGTGKMYFTIPNELNGLDLKSCGAHLYTAGSGVTHITLYNVTSAVDMLTSKMEIDTAEKDSKDASSAAVINAAADGVLVGEEIRVDISTAASAAKGLEVRAAFG